MSFRKYCAASITSLLGLQATVRAQFFPPTPEGLTVVKSKFNENITISFKEPGLCETTPGVRSYAGYVHLPPGTVEGLGQEQNYPINTFFWYFEARKDPKNAPLSIWLNGGPGSSSMYGLLTENGPCFVNSDSNSTRLNPNSWNNEVNMLYIEQPVQVGFSYDTLRNVTIDVLTEQTYQIPNGTVPEQTELLRVGTLPSGNLDHTAQGTRNAAKMMWDFAQVWFQEFPGYDTSDSRISISTQSFGGRYAPAFADYFEEQNDKIRDGKIASPGKQYIINLDTLLFVNSCIDRPVQWPSYPQMAYNNTYGIQAVDKFVFDEMNDVLYRKGGCLDMIADCQAVASVYDPENLGINATTNAICEDAENFCSGYLRSEAIGSRYDYDITQNKPNAFPDPFFAGWLNQPHVQAALGVPLNYTRSSSDVARAFRDIGDYPRPGWLGFLADLLDRRGVKVALVYGDRDYACNWIGGEAASLAINYTASAQFHAAGYEPLQTNASFQGGLVRQFGNLSFSRIFQAGHEMPAYQPETALAVFNRALGNRDIATGTVDAAGHSSKGPLDTWATKSVIPKQRLWYCYLYDVDTCTTAQINAVLIGTARVVRYIVEDANSTALFPELFSAS